MFGQPKKQVIIVYGENQKKYANFLSQLIIAANKDEDGENTEGEEKTILSAAVWNEKHFTDQEKILNGMDKIIFVGETKSARDNMLNTELSSNKNKCGISYGWFGNRAFIMVEDRLLEKEEVEVLNSLCKELGETLEIKSKADKFVNWTRVIGTMFIVPSMPIISAAVIANYFRIKAKDKKQQIDQQYKFAVLKFHMDSLSEFLGE